MKKFFILLFLSMTTPMLAQTNIGVDYYLLGEYEKAKQHFKSQLTVSPAQANLYLGRIAFAEGRMEEAAEYFRKYAEAVPGGAFGEIGKAKLKLKTDLKGAESILNSVSRSNRNNMTVIIAIGRAYLDNGMRDKAMGKVDDAKKINSKAPEIYILEGDIIASEKNTAKIGEVAGMYEMSNYFDPEYHLGYMKTAQVYSVNNPHLAIENLNTVIENYPDYKPAYEMLAKIYTNTGYHHRAIEIFRNYPPTVPEDIERYARSLYFTDNFDEAQTIISEILKDDPDNFVMNRLRLYIYAKTGNFTDGLEMTDKFFSLGDPARYIALDFTSYASLLKAAGRYEEALAQYNRAIGINPDNPEQYKEVSEAAKEMGRYGMAGDYYRAYIDKMLDTEGPGYTGDRVDMHALGTNYYQAGRNIDKDPALAAELMKDKDLTGKIAASDSRLDPGLLANDIEYFTNNYALYYYKKASETFSTLIEMAPESYIGYRMKALAEHASAVISPDVRVSPVAKEYYEKMLDVLTAREDVQISDAASRTIMEAYDYLATYYYMNDDTTKAIEYCNKILELDPENAKALSILEDLRR